MKKLLFSTVVPLLQLLVVEALLSKTINLPVEKVNSVLKIFQPCQNDIIFVGKAEDIRPEYPVVLHSLFNNSESFRTHASRDYLYLEDGCHLHEDLNVSIHFHCVNYNPFLKAAVNFRFNCLGILLLMSYCKFC